MKKIKVLYDNSINDCIHILIYICDRCNYTCEYCYNAMPRTLMLMDLNILLSFLINIKLNTRKKIYIELIGGEPTLHPDLLDFCKKCNTYTNIIISVYTNFSQSIDYYIQLLQLNVKLIISYHSQAQNFIEKIKKIPNYFINTKYINLIIMLESNKFNKSLDIYNQLYNNYYSVLELNILDHDSIQNIYSFSQINKIYKLTNTISKYKKLEFNVIYADNTIDMLDIKTINLYYNTFKFWKCNAGKDSLYIHVNGDVYPCQGYFSNQIYKMHNIYLTSCFKMRDIALLCKADKCSCEIGVYKENIFKH